MKSPAQLYLNKTVLTAEQFAVKYLKQKIDTSNLEHGIGGYTGIIVGYCDCGCGNLVVELEEENEDEGEDEEYNVEYVEVRSCNLSEQG